MNIDKQRVLDAAIALTGMRNLLALTKQYVEFVTSELHCSNWFAKDKGHIIVNPSTCDTETGAMTLSVSMRKVTGVYVKTQYSTSQYKVHDSLTSYLDDTSSAKAVLVGNSLTLAISRDVQSVLVEGITKVDVSDDGYNSWMEAEFPGVVSQEVAARVLESINDATSINHKRNAKLSYLRMLEGGVLLEMPR